MTNMSQEERPLYGELVAGFAPEGGASSGEEEFHALEHEVRHMIEEAAYFIAEKRGFHPGYDTQDRLEAAGQIARRAAAGVVAL
jgi:hypothetical protein